MVADSVSVAFLPAFSESYRASCRRYFASLPPWLRLLTGSGYLGYVDSN